VLHFRSREACVKQSKSNSRREYLIVTWFCFKTEAQDEVLELLKDLTLGHQGIKKSTSDAETAAGIALPYKAEEG
jgi:hypothetical protein